MILKLICQQNINKVGDYSYIFNIIKFFVNNTSIRISITTEFAQERNVKFRNKPLGTNFTFSIKPNITRPKIIFKYMFITRGY